MKYVVIEVQVQQDGTVACLSTVHDTIEEARQKYHQVLSFAAVSQLAQHSCTLMNQMGAVEISECYEHAAQQEE